MDLEGDETVMIQLSTQGYVVEGGTDEEYQSFNEGIIIFFTFLILFLHHNVFFYFLFFIFFILGLCYMVCLSSMSSVPFSFSITLHFILYLFLIKKSRLWTLTIMFNINRI
jgi:hypothetical protein